MNPNTLGLILGIVALVLLVIWLLARRGTGERDDKSMVATKAGSQLRPGPRAIVQDPNAKSASPDLPAFLAKPRGAPVYHGFPLVPETRTHGWTLGVISNPFGPDDDDGPWCTFGDAYVQGPLGARAGIVWSSSPHLRFAVVSEPSETRWGVYAFEVPIGVRDMDDLIWMFRLMLPTLRWMRVRAILSRPLPLYAFQAYTMKHMPEPPDGSRPPFEDEDWYDD